MSEKTIEQLIAEGEEQERCDPEAVHSYFGLSYAHYLVLPRLALQTMPAEWQRRFVKCLGELCDAIDFEPEGLEYHVQLRDKSTHKIVALARDPLNDYRHGRCEYKGPSSSGRTSACEAEKVGSSPSGPSEKGASAADIYLTRMDVVGQINRERNWLGAVAEAIQGGCHFNLTGCGKITGNIRLLRRLRQEYNIYEVW